MARIVGVLVALLLLAASAASAESDLPRRYRDLKVYAVSEPHADDAGTIEVRVQFRNEGQAPLAIRAELGANQRLGFSGGRFEARIGPGEKANWDFQLKPPEDLRREVLEGSIWFGDTRDRELYVAVQSPDPAEWPFPRIAQITAKAQVVAAYVPRTLESVRATVASRPATKAPLITLAKGGESDYRILRTDLPGGLDEATLLNDPKSKPFGEAVNDLRRCIEIQSGAALPIASGRPGGGRHIAIRIDASEKWPLPDSYRIRTDGDGNVHLTAGSIDGLRQAIYGLLTDHLGCRWYMPAQMGEEIPVNADKTVVIGQIDELKTPSFFSCSGMSWGDSPLWDARNRALIGGAKMHFGHAWSVLLPPSEEAIRQHPDWWARDREGNVRTRRESWTATNFCSTSPEVIEMVAKAVNAQFDADPSAIVASLDPNDNAPMCLCDRCLGLDKSYGVTDETGRFASDRLLHFSKEIHDRLKAQHKDKYLGILIYGRQFDLPIRAKAHPRHAGLICQYPPRVDHSRPFNDPTSREGRRFNILVQGWGERLSMLGFYDYYGHYHYFGPWGVIHKMREDIPAVREAGASFMIIEAQPNFGMHGLNLYTAARLAWDADADVDLLLEDYFTRFYGPGADAMRAFWLTNEKWFALLRPGTDTARHMATKAEFWEEMDRLLKDAERAVASVPASESRYRERVMFHRDAFEVGRRIWETEWKFLRRAGEPDVEGAIAANDAAQPFYGEMKRKYADRQKWPTLMREYFYPSPDRFRERHQTAQSRPAGAASRPAASVEASGPAFLSREQLDRY